MGGFQSAMRSLPGPQPGCFFNHVPRPHTNWYSSFPFKWFATMRDYDCDCRMIGQCPGGPPPHPPVQEFLRSAGLENLEQLPREPEQIYKTDWSLGHYDPPAPQKRRVYTRGLNDPQGSKPFLKAAVEAFYNLPLERQEQLLKKYLGTDILAGKDPFKDAGHVARHRTDDSPEYIIVNMTESESIKKTHRLNTTKDKEEERRDMMPYHKPNQPRQLIIPTISPGFTDKNEESVDITPSFQPMNGTQPGNYKSRELVEFSKNPYLMLSSLLANPSLVPNNPDYKFTNLINHCTTLAMDKAKTELAAPSVLKIQFNDPEYSNLKESLLTFFQQPWKFHTPSKLPPSPNAVDFEGKPVKWKDDICEVVIEEASSNITDSNGQVVYMNDVIDVMDAMFAAVWESETKVVPIQPEVEETITPLVTGEVELNEELLKKMVGSTWPVLAVALGFFTVSLNAAPELVTL